MRSDTRKKENTASTLTIIITVTITTTTHALLVPVRTNTRSTNTMHRHNDTPKKARIQGAFEFLEAQKLPYYKTDLFKHFNVSHATGYRILKDQSSRMRQHQPNAVDNRGGKRKLAGGPAGLDELEGGLYGKDGSDAGVSSRTVQRHADTRDLFKQLAEQLECKTQAECERRLAWANEALTRRPEPENWRDVLFSDECHFGYDDEGTARARPLNLQGRRQPAERDLKRLHCWAAIGHNFKSPLIWYDFSTNADGGRMTQATYQRERLEPYIKKWMGEGKSFVLEDDGDSSDPARAWKEQYGPERFFNCPRSSELSPIENAWLVPEEYIREDANWDDETLKSLAEESWDQLQQEEINSWIATMPQRLCDVKGLQGKMSRC